MLWQVEVKQIPCKQYSGKHKEASYQATKATSCKAAMFFWFWSSTDPLAIRNAQPSVLSCHCIGVARKKTTVIICNFLISFYSSKLHFALKINQSRWMLIKLVFYAKRKLLLLFPICAQKSWQTGTYQEQQCSFRLQCSNLRWTFSNKSQVNLHKKTFFQHMFSTQVQFIKIYLYSIISVWYSLLCSIPWKKACSLQNLTKHLPQQIFGTRKCFFKFTH